MKPVTAIKMATWNAAREYGLRDLGAVAAGYRADLVLLDLSLIHISAFPFLMLAAFCFARSSRRLNDWFLSTRLYKNHLESFVRCLL